MSSGATAGDRVCDSLDGAVDEVALLEPGESGPAVAARSLVQLRRTIDRLEGEFARLAVEVAKSDVWSESGASSMPTWLSKQTGMGIGRARASLELGSAMRDVPALDDAVRSGELSPSAASKVISAVGDDRFVDVAAGLVEEMKGMIGMTAAAAGRHIDAWRAVANPADDAERREQASADRTLTFRPLGDGMTHIEGVLPNGTARSLRQALAHLAEQQRLDGSERTRDQRQVDALAELVDAYKRGEVIGGRNLPRIIVTMTLDGLMSHGVGRDTFTGEAITSSEIDRLCCDAVIHRYVTDQGGAPLNFGRGQRTASTNQFLAMIARDGGCRHPGCERPPQWCQAHHLREFAARGGLTDLDEMVLLCHHHHHALHDDGWVLSGDPTHLTFTGPNGQVLQSPIPRPLPRHDTKKAA